MAARMEEVSGLMDAAMGGGVAGEAGVSGGGTAAAGGRVGSRPRGGAGAAREASAALARLRPRSLLRLFLSYIVTHRRKMSAV